MPQFILDIKLPMSWRNLTDSQLRFAFTRIASDRSATAIATQCLLRWNRLHVLHADGPVAVLRKGHHRFLLSAQQIAEAIQTLSWLSTLPERPVRVAQAGGAEALAANFAGVPFEQFLVCDNLYQGYLQTHSSELLAEMATVLYPGIRLRRARPQGTADAEPADPWLLTCVFYWFASLKQHLAREYPHFFRAAPGNALGPVMPTRRQLQEAMNTQIRALTKGDITKEREVLAMDTHRALTELDAQAREYETLHSKSNKQP